MAEQERCSTCHRAFRKDRSNSQNSYYWAVVVKLLSDHTGFNDSEMHEVLKYKFLTQKKILSTKKGDEDVSISTSTTKLTTKQFEEFMTKVRQWASIDLDCYIPEPNEIPIEES